MFTMSINTPDKFTWYLQIQDLEHNVLVLNHKLGVYKRNSKFVDKAITKVAANFPETITWEARTYPFTRSVPMFF